MTTCPRPLLFTDADVFAGTERYILDLSMGLRTLGCNPSVACPVPSALASRSVASSIDVVPIDKGGLVDLSAIRTLSSLVKSRSIGVIHANNGRTQLSAAIAVRLRRRGACIFTQHFLEPAHVRHTGPKAALFRAVHRWVNRRTAAFIAISQAAKDAMLDRGDAPESKITVVHNGIPEPDLTDAAPPEQVRAELGVDQNDRLVVCLARLEREKDVATLVAAMAEVARHSARAVCVVAGTGSLEPTLSAQIGGFGLEGRVRLLGFRTDAYALLRAADLFVLPSLAEPFGLVLLEAMALGKPVIATRAGGPMEIVQEGETGLLVPPGDSEEMAEGILQLLGSRERCDVMGKAGYERYRAHFTVERMARETLAVYERALAGR